MPLQNRVDPWGQLNAIRASGARLVWQGAMHHWSADGYKVTEALHAPAQTVTVLTPASITALSRSGFKPQVDASVRS